MTVTHKQKILLICHDVVFPLNSGGRQRTWQFISSLYRDFDLTLICPVYGSISDDEVATLTQYCRNVKHVPLEDTRYWARQRLGHRIKNMVQSIPWELDGRYYESLARVIEETMARDAYDYVLVRYIAQAQYLFRNRQTIRARIIVDLDDIETVKVARHMELEGFANAYDRWRKWLNLRLYEHYHKIHLRTIHRCLVCSARDVEYVSRLGWSKRVIKVPNAIDVRGFDAGAVDLKNKVFLFCGTLSYEPNIDGLLWFVHNVFCHMKAMDHDIKLHVVGRGPTNEVRSLEKDPAIVVHADVPDVIPFYREASVVVVPIRMGSGTRIKILEAAACCRPVMTTSIGAEGLDLVHNRHCMIEDDPLKMAKACVDLLKDDQLVHRLTQEHLRFVRDNYDLNVVQRTIRDLFTS